jgi:hypothetical protein
VKIQGFISSLSVSKAWSYPEHEDHSTEERTEKSHQVTLGTEIKENKALKLQHFSKPLKKEESKINK